MTDDICPTCLNPKKSKSDGSLTQWIMACSCDVAPEPDLEQTAIELCQACGKKIGRGRQGSFTQFIFRSDLCGCDLPKPIRHGAGAEPAGPRTPAGSPPLEPGAGHESDSAPDADELPLDKDVFPSERYKALAELGAGAGSKVYLARDRLLNKLVAVKTLPAASPQTLISFQDEARATSRLRHRSIANIIDFGATSGGTPYMVLDYVEGQSLQAMIEADCTLDWNLCRSIFIEICEALSYAHEHGIFHRDIKPSNVLVHQEEAGDVEVVGELTVRIIDWGIAVNMAAGGEDESLRELKGDAIVGTPFYMSPDQGLGRPYDSRSEIYSLGCVLFECLAGSPPFAGESALETLSLHASSKPPRLTDMVPDSRIPKEVDTVIEKALQKEPESRYQSMQQFAEDLENIPENTDEQSRQIKPVPPDEGSVNRRARAADTLALLRNVLLGLLVLGGAGFFAYETIQPKKFAKPMPIELSYPTTRYEDVRSLRSLLDRDLDRQEEWQEKDGQLHTGSDIADEDLKRWHDKDIVDLNIKMTDRFTGDGLKYVKPDRLVRAEIISRNFDDHGAAQLLRFRNLQELRIAQSNALTARAFEEIVKLPSLKRLNLMSLTLPAGAIDLIARKSDLQWLIINGCSPLTVDDVEKIAAMPHLGLLILSNLTIDDSFVPALIKAKVGDVDINHTKITGKGLLRLAENKNIKHLVVSTGDGITTEDFFKFEKLRPDCDLEARGFMGLPADAGTIF